MRSWWMLAAVLGACGGADLPEEFVDGFVQRSATEDLVDGRIVCGDAPGDADVEFLGIEGDVLLTVVFEGGEAGSPMQGFGLDYYVNDSSIEGDKDFREGFVFARSEPAARADFLLHCP